MPRETNPRELSDKAVSILVSEDRCPMCIGHLDTGWECNDCGYDARPWISSSIAKHEQAFNNREA
jgi:hypothetical protein